MYDPNFLQRRAVAIIVSGKHRRTSLTSASITNLSGTVSTTPMDAVEQLRQAAPTQNPAERPEDRPWNEALSQSRELR